MGGPTSDFCTGLSQGSGATPNRSLATVCSEGDGVCTNSLRDGQRGLQRVEITRRGAHVVACPSFRGSGSLMCCVSFRKRKGDEVDGLDQVPKKKPKKEKDKDAKLEKALKVSAELCPSPFCLSSSLVLGRRLKEVCVPLTKTCRNSHVDGCC